MSTLFFFITLFVAVSFIWLYFPFDFDCFVYHSYYFSIKCSFVFKFVSIPLLYFYLSYNIFFLFYLSYYSAQPYLLLPLVVYSVVAFSFFLSFLDLIYLISLFHVFIVLLTCKEFSKIHFFFFAAKTFLFFFFSAIHGFFPSLFFSFLFLLSVEKRCIFYLLFPLHMILFVFFLFALTFFQFGKRNIFLSIYLVWFLCLMPY